MPTLTSPSGREEQGCLMQVGLPLANLENSSHESQSEESEGLFKDTANNNPGKSKFPTSCPSAEFLAKFQSCVNTDHGQHRPEAII